VKAQHARTVEQLAPRLSDAAKMLADAGESLAFTNFAKEHRRQIGSNNPQEPLQRVIRRRTEEGAEAKGVGPRKHAAWTVQPDDASCTNLTDLTSHQRSRGTETLTRADEAWPTAGRRPVDT